MLLLRVSGHSGAGKSRLLKQLKKKCVPFHRTILFTTRSPRPGEVNGVDYRFVSREQLERLPAGSYYVGSVREMLQAVDLVKLESDLETGELVIVEIYHRLWPGLEREVRDRVSGRLKTASVFLCALDIEKVRSYDTEEARRIIEDEVRRILLRRAADDDNSIARRAASAADEVLDALRGAQHYDRILRTSPEGPDGEDDWTCPGGPRGRAAEAVKDFVDFIETFGHWSGDRDLS